MCELMGLCFAKPVSADFSIREFARRGEENADGWGLAWYPDQSLALVKEPVKWAASAYTGFLESYQGLRARIYLAHVRYKTTGGEPTHADTHPFARELGGRDYCFAHNGTVEGHQELPLGRFHPVGVTDSEHVFCYLLEEVARRDGHLQGEENWRWLHAMLTALNRKGRLNCLFSDGARLFVYHDANGYKGLTLRRVSLRDQQTRHLEDPTLEVDLGGDAANQGYVAATCPLSRNGWSPFQPGELVVLEAGVLRFSSHRREPTSDTTHSA